MKMLKLSGRSTLSSSFSIKIHNMVSGTNFNIFLISIVCLNVFVLSESIATASSTDINNSFNNQTTTNSHLSNNKSAFSTGNTLWDNLIRDCLRRPTFSCIQKNVFTYLDDTLDIGNFNVSNRLMITKNTVDYTKYTKEVNEKYYDINNNEIPDVDGRSSADLEPLTPIEEVTTALYGKSLKFMMTHNMDLKMPEIMFDGAILRIEPRSLEGNGMIAKLEFLPKTEIESRSTSTGRIFFKKIKKFFKNKLLLAFVAIVLVIKIIKIKVMWLLPLLVGVGTAKKLILKFLLFLFPALAHIFKLCSYYHSSFHKPNFHHHQHNINHLHTFYPEHDHGHHVPELIYTKPPKGHPSEYIHGAPVPPHQHYQPDWEFSGPGLGSEGPYHKSHPGYPSGPVYQPPNAQKRVPTGAATQIAAQYVSAPTATAPEDIIIREAQRQEAYRIQNEQKLIAKQQQILNHQAYVQEGQTPRPVDAFYTPILQRLDKTFLQLGIQDEYCRERLVCSMYKHPVKYSPHSNYVSAELSRDSSELQKPLATNSAVIRFYKYVQAARDGQDQRDCLRLYPQCAINTEKKK